MKRAAIPIIVLIGMVVLFATLWTRLTVRISGHGFPIEGRILLGEYGYSSGGDRLRFAILRTWSADSTAAQRENDSRRGSDFLGWPLIRDHDGRMVPVGAEGQVYLFDGDELKTMTVKMSEHTDIPPMEDSTTLDEVWAYLERFRIDGKGAADH